MKARPITLLVVSNADDALLIRQAMAAQALPNPTHIQTGEEAVIWVRAEECDICVVDYNLGGIDGLETLHRLHQRKPDLAVIMLSGAKSEQVAVSAFRSGVRDYVIKAPGFADVLAQAIRQVARTLSLSDVTAVPIATSAGTLPGFLRPTYENRLRAVGRQLDLYGYSAINLSEVAGGFLVRALPRGGRIAEALEFLDRDAAQVLSQAVAARGEGGRTPPTAVLLPTGYEDFLRALGQYLDVGNAHTITITELEPMVAVGGLSPLNQGEYTGLVPFYELLQADQIKKLLDEAFRRRTVSRTGLTRLFGR